MLHQLLLLLTLLTLLMLLLLHPHQQHLPLCSVSFPQRNSWSPLVTHTPPPTSITTQQNIITSQDSSSHMNLDMEIVRHEA
jgi:hypothetical protein